MKHAGILRIALLGVMSLGCARGGLSLGGDAPGDAPTPTPTPAATPAPTPNPNGGFGLPLTVQGGYIDNDLDDFPVWVDVTRPELRDENNGGHVLDAGGADFLFVAGESVLAFELVDYAPDTGRLQGWVRVPFLFEKVDTTVFLYYGEPGLVGQQPPLEDVWTNRFAAVWHLEDVGDADDGPVLDSTANWIDGMDQSAAPAVSGIAGRAASFAATDDTILIPDANAEIDEGGLNGGRGDFTVAAWFRRSAATGGWDTILEKGVFTDPDGWGFYVERQNGPETLALYLCNGQGVQSRTQVRFSPTDDQWYYLVAVVDRSGFGEEVDFFVDGQSIGSDSVSFNVQGDSINTPGDSTLGSNTGVDSCCSTRGNLDEIMVSAGKRSKSWIAASYANQADPAGFVVAGTEVAF